MPDAAAAGAGAGVGLRNLRGAACARAQTAPAMVAARGAEVCQGAADAGACAHLCERVWGGALVEVLIRQQWDGGGSLQCQGVRKGVDQVDQVDGCDGSVKCCWEVW